jgi:hypothetical protein
VDAVPISVQRQSLKALAPISAISKKPRLGLCHLEMHLEKHLEIQGKTCASGCPAHGVGVVTCAKLVWLLPVTATWNIEGADTGYVSSHILGLHPAVIRKDWLALPHHTCLS